MEPVTTPRRTPFHEFHRAAGAKLVDFAGFEMPVRYTGDVREHQAVRERVGLFDISHMGEFDVRGPEAAAFLDRAVTNDVRALAPGQALYSPLCRPDGGIVDDLLVYRYDDHFMVVVNASNIAKDFAWLAGQKPAGVQLADRSDATALLAVQGPRAAAVLRGHVPDAALDLGYYRFTTGALFGVPATISRTGYTGEDGFELYFDPAHAARVWEGVVEAGRPHGLELIGLGARDTLRLEMGYMLYGNDIDDHTSPLEAGLGWTVKFGKPDFSGRAALERQKAAGLTRRLVGFQLDGRRVPRHGMTIRAGGRDVGVVTSGTYSPSLERPLGMGYVETASAAAGTALEIAAGTSMLAARVTARPFWTRGSHRA
ncbi:MAG TPA: glycine cleavage system aminomethyltransferase GcvT [Candidatus Eisenbacteria bacterium]|nr:glycine cleavage system aminomethyltransferase GcvT [Candidatus Eisenbacteria bacterium]